MTMKRRLLPFLAVALGLAPGRANPDFDRWADAFSADWVRTNPAFATAAQYFSGAEQDALDRQLGGNFGRKFAEENARRARRGRDEMGRLPETSLTAALPPVAGFQHGLDLQRRLGALRGALGGQNGGTTAIRRAGSDTFNEQLFLMRGREIERGSAEKKPESGVTGRNGRAA